MRSFGWRCVADPSTNERLIADINANDERWAKERGLSGGVVAQRLLINRARVQGLSAGQMEALAEIKRNALG